MIPPRAVRWAAAAMALLLAAACGAGGTRLAGTVTAVSPRAQTLTVRDASGETTVQVDDATHFWSGSGLDQIQTGDRVSLRVERQGEVIRARSVQIFPAGRPRARWVGPGGY